MSTPTKMSERTSSPEMTSKSTQMEIEVKDTKNIMTSGEQNISDPGKVNILFLVFMLKNIL
jgi:hypothetical protein